MSLQRGLAATIVVLALGSLPNEVSPPGALTPLRFTSRTGLAWEDRSISGSDTFDLYRGDPSLLPGNAGSCLQSGLLYGQATDLATPAPRHAYSYLVGGRNVRGRGPLGSSTNAVPRTPGTFCP